MTTFAPARVEATTRWARGAATALAASLVAALGVPPSATASFAVDPRCGRAIIENTTLQDDIGPCDRDGVLVGADNITLDLNGHRIFGLDGPADGHQAGIRITDHSGVTVKNGTVAGFDAGLFLSGGNGNHTITGMTIRDNLGPDQSGSQLGDGIYVENSPAAHIVDNTLINNGIFDGIGIYGVRSGGATVERNTVEDTRGPSNRSDSYGQGIIVNAFVDATDRGKTVSGMRILNNTVRRSDSAGISNFNSTDGVISSNTVEGNGLRNPNGNGIAAQLGPGAPPGSRLTIQGNQVHGNGRDGIRLDPGATGNTVLNNNAAGNNALGSGSFDLHDRNDLCAGNLWSGNMWGSGGFDPACTTTGGSQVTPVRHPPADFDGDGTTDVSVFRAASGTWYVKGGATNTFGTDGDVPVPGDYDGDGDTDIAVFRPSSGIWFVKGLATTQWGAPTDIPVPGDYDGDAKTDVAVYRPASGAWYVRRSDGGPDLTTAWGAQGDIPVPGDYNGDGRSEIAVFRPSNGVWYVNGGAATAFGTQGDIPVPGDYDGNGASEIAVFRPASGVWFILGGASTGWGASGDIPVPGDYDGNGASEIAVFRPSNGVWYVNGGAATAFGTQGDRPLPLPAAIAGFV